MTQHFNKNEYKTNRQLLRNSPTAAERILWNELKGKKHLGYKFRRQYGVDQFVIDFYCPALNLAIELDGDVHSVKDVHKYDIKRQEFIETFGISFLRFSNKDVLEDLHRVLNLISEEIKNIRS